MTNTNSTFSAMTLFTYAGERKYLSAAERQLFLASLTVLPDPAERTYCEMLCWTGCRASEALALTPLNIDLADAVVVVRSLKKRGPEKHRHFRQIPVPADFVARLDAVHGIAAAQENPHGAGRDNLWPMSRTTAWRRVRAVMEAAGLHGEKASAKGLRHAYGVNAAVANIPETRIRKWLGHASLSTTEIYLDMAGPEDRALADKMWPGILAAY